MCECDQLWYEIALTVCRILSGCAHKLSHIEEPVEVMNRVWERESGGTAAHIFRARHPNSRSGYAVAKVLCMPFGKRGSEHLAPDCSEDSNEVRVYVWSAPRATPCGVLVSASAPASGAGCHSAGQSLCTLSQRVLHSDDRTTGSYVCMACT